MRLLLIAATLIAILASTGFAAQRWWPFGSDERTDVLLENQRLRLGNERLVQENAGLLADNENLRERLNELAREGERLGPLPVEIERLRGERDQARFDLAEASATVQQLGRALDDERQTRIRQDEIIRNISNDRGDGSPGSLGWLVLLVLVLLASVAFWRERWWRSRILTTVRQVPVMREGTNAVARRVTDVASVKLDVEDR